MLRKKNEFSLEKTNNLNEIKLDLTKLWKVTPSKALFCFIKNIYKQIRFFYSMTHCKIDFKKIKKKYFLIKKKIANCSNQNKKFFSLT